MVPVFFAVFANDDGKSLSLSEERDALSNIFNDKTKVELRILENAKFKNITDTIINEALAERIVVFHYGGHADGNNIKLEDGAVHSAALASLLKTMPNLQLVVLNGCDTHEQAQDLQKAAIHAAVITTVTPLDDRIAINFADFFYYPFYRFNTLNDSFSFAKARIIARYGNDKNYFAKHERGIGFTEDNRKENGDGTVYILFSENKEVLGRTFLFTLEYTFLKNVMPPNNYRPNRQLIESLSKSILTGTYLNEALKESDDYKTFAGKFDKYAGENSNENFGKLVQSVLSLLPFPLSFHLALLKSSSNNWSNQPREKKYELLKRQIITYNSLIQLLAYTLLSSFWNELHKGNKLNVSISEWDVLEGFLNTSQSNVQDINYPVLISTITNIFKKSELEQFISEYQQLENFFEKEEGFYNAHLQMQGLKSSIANNEIAKMDIDWLCSQAEEILSAILSKAGFVIKYKLTTIKHIEITKPRFKSPVYYIQRIFLDGATVNDDDIAGYPTYTDTRSVILAKGADKEKFTDFLNLSPFIIDENALKGENLSNLFFYSHDEKDYYVYRRTENPDEKMIVHKNAGNDFKSSILGMRINAIKEELDEFKVLVSNNKQVLIDDNPR